jgi:hypothetical protein
MVHPMDADAPLSAGLLVGLSDGDGIDLGLGLLKGADGETLAVCRRQKAAPSPG